MKKEVLQSIKVIALGLVLAFGINFAMAAWSEPQVAPTDGNTLGPITVGKLGDSADESKRQKKYDGLNLAGSLSIGKVSKDSKGNVTDVNSPMSGTTLDVYGITHTQGISNIGLIGIIPSGGKDGQLFEIFGTTSDWTVPSSAIFAVDTTPSALSTNTQNLVVKKNASIFGDSVTYGDAVANKSSAGALRVGYDAKFGTYDLTLNGTTNIGLGGICKLSKSDVVTDKLPCPAGTYLSFMDPTATGDDFAICKSFDTIANYSGGNCYTFPALTLSQKSIKEELRDMGMGNVYQPYCVPKVTVAVNTSGGSGKGYGYSWSFKDPATDWQPKAINGCTTSSCTFDYAYNRSVYKGHNFTGIVSITVTDSRNAKYTINFSQDFASSKVCY